jgi:hypothetical protein
VRENSYMMKSQYLRDKAQEKLEKRAIVIGSSVIFLGLFLAALHLVLTR